MARFVVTLVIDTADIYDADLDGLRDDIALTLHDADDMPVTVVTSSAVQL